MGREVRAKAVPRCPFCFGPVDDDGRCIERPHLRCRDVRLKLEKDYTAVYVWIMLGLLFTVPAIILAINYYLKG